VEAERVGRQFSRLRSVKLRCMAAVGAEWSLPVSYSLDGRDSSRGTLGEKTMWEPGLGPRNLPY
jgi:hypothetical protein